MVACPSKPSNRFPVILLISPKMKLVIISGEALYGFGVGSPITMVDIKTNELCISAMSLSMFCIRYCNFLSFCHNASTSSMICCQPLILFENPFFLVLPKYVLSILLFWSMLNVKSTLFSSQFHPMHWLHFP